MTPPPEPAGGRDRHGAGAAGQVAGRGKATERDDGGLAAWLDRQGLLRGPFLYQDYWDAVLRLGLPGTARRREAGLVAPDLFRLGLDRPDLEVPRLRHYLLLFLVGPFLLPFRAFRRLGRYRLSYRSEVAREVLERLEDYRLELTAAGATGAPGGPGVGGGRRKQARQRAPEEPAEDDGAGETARVDARLGGRTVGRDLLHPHRVPGFVSLFYATYKLPLASLTAIVAAALLVPVARTTGTLEPALDLWIPVGFPLLVGLLYLVWRDWLTALLGAFPVVVVRFLFPLLDPGAAGGWTGFGLALGGLFLLYLLIDWFFMPRPVPPTLMLYTSDGPGRPYDREEDAPWWLEGDDYWVWRYLMLTPAELNKFWERDWERIELWIRADGEEAGRLEWVVTDAHYREVWIPLEKLGSRDRVARQLETAGRTEAAGRAGFWLLEADADPVFHAPFMRAVSFVPEEERVPTHGVGHLVSALWKQAERDDPERFRREVERARARTGVGLFRDAPEVASGLVSRHMLSQPWRWWRYPRGAATRREVRLYGDAPGEGRPPAADPELQVKRTAGDLR